MNYHQFRYPGQIHNIPVQSAPQTKVSFSDDRMDKDRNQDKAALEKQEIAVVDIKIKEKNFTIH